MARKQNGYSMGEVMMDERNRWPTPHRLIDISAIRKESESEGDFTEDTDIGFCLGCPNFDFEARCKYGEVPPNCHGDDVEDGDEDG